MTAGVKSADLPKGSIVVNVDVVFIRALDGIGAVWRSTNGSQLHDSDIDKRLVVGAQVLRVGYGEAS